MKKQLCVFCQKEAASRFCDFILGFKMGGYSGSSRQVAILVGRLAEFVPGMGLPCVDSDDHEMFTCDAPICEACSKNSGHVFFDGNAKSTFVESIDYCPVHLVPDPAGQRPITAEVAERMRFKAWKHKLEIKAFGVVK